MGRNDIAEMLRPRAQLIAHQMARAGHTPKGWGPDYDWHQRLDITGFWPTEAGFDIDYSRSRYDLISLHAVRPLDHIRNEKVEIIEAGPVETIDGATIKLPNYDAFTPLAIGYNPDFRETRRINDVRMQGFTQAVSIALKFSEGSEVAQFKAEQSITTSFQARQDTRKEDETKTEKGRKIAHNPVAPPGVESEYWAVMKIQPKAVRTTGELRRGFRVHDRRPEPQQGQPRQGLQLVAEIQLALQQLLGRLPAGCSGRGPAGRDALRRLCAAARGVAGEGPRGSARLAVRPHLAAVRRMGDHRAAQADSEGQPENQPGPVREVAGQHRRQRTMKRTRCDSGGARFWRSGEHGTWRAAFPAASTKRRRAASVDNPALAGTFNPGVFYLDHGKLAAAAGVRHRRLAVFDTAAVLRGGALGRASEDGMSHTWDWAAGAAWRFRGDTPLSMDLGLDFEPMAPGVMSGDDIDMRARIGVAWALSHGRASSSSGAGRCTTGRTSGAG